MALSCPHCGATHPKSLARCPATGLPIAGDPTLVGSTLAGRYHLVRLLGDGGMGAVFKAADQVLRRFVAIKLLHPSVAANPASVERFQREARAAAAIGHPNIIDILDFGNADNGTPYMVMEYLRGRSLAHAIVTEGALDMARACAIASHTLSGLAAAHERGILHRDVKPGNLMLSARFGDKDFVKICDFGFATLLQPQEGEGDTLTPARTLVGTPAYAPPERMRGDTRPDPRIDVYSVGVVLFEMLTGSRPWDAPSFLELSRKVLREPPPPLRVIRADVPAELEEIVMRALSKQPDERWVNAVEFAEALSPFGGKFVPLDENPSEVFTMDLVRIRAREAKRRDGTDQIMIAAVDAAFQARGLPNEDAPTDREHHDDHDEERPTSLEIQVEMIPQHESGATRIDPTIDRDGVTRRVRGDPTEPVFPSKRARVARGDELIVEPPPLIIPIEAQVEPAFEGTVGLSVLRFVARRFGERSLKVVLDSLDPDARMVFDRGILPGVWVPRWIVLQLIERIDALLGQDDLHLVVDCGRATAESAFDLMRAAQGGLKGGPEELLNDLPRVAAEIVRGVEYNVARVGAGHARVELFEHGGHPSLIGCVATLGFLDRSLGRFGAEDVEVTLLGCRALGDPRCAFEISWL